MTGPYDPPSDPTLSHPLIEEAFGFRTADEVPPSVRLGISQAADTVGALQSAATTAITNQWAGAAVNADMLQGKAAYSIAGQLQAAANTTAALQQPVAMSVLGPLSQAVEQSNVLGTVPPMPGAQPGTPACVAIRTGALNGDLGPAIEAYRLMAFQQRFTRGKQYTDAVQFIQNCLPTDQRIQEQFANVILQLQNQPDTVPYTSGAAGNQAIGGVPYGPGQTGVQLGAGTAPSGSGSGAGFTQASSIPIGGGIFAPQTVLRADNPVLSETIPPPPAGNIALGNAPPPAAGGVSNPGNLIPGSGIPPGAGMPSPMPPGSIPGSGPPPSLINPPGFTTLPGSGAPPGSGTGPAVSPPPGTIQFPGAGPGGTTVCQNQYGQVWTIPAGMVCGSGPPPGSPPATVPPGNIPETPVSPGTPPTSSGAPPPATCPPPPPPQCIKICPPDKPTTPPKKCDYTAWCSAASGILYVVRSDQPARGPSDTKLASGDPVEWNWQSLQSQCGPQPTQPGQEVPAAVVPLQVPAVCGEFGAAPGARIPGGDVSLAAMLGLVNADGSPWVPFPGAGVTDIGQNIANYLAQAFEYPLVQASSIIQGVLSGNPCYDGVMSSLIGGDALLGLAERWVGVSLDTYRIPNAYNRHFKCPVLLPSISEAASAWLAGEIDEPTLQCWVAANNGRYPEISTAIRAARTKLAPLQYAQLYMRDYIGQQDFQNRIRETGMIRPTDGDDLLNLLKVIPPPGDIISMMVKDAADTQNINWDKEDAEFPQKYQGQLADWGRQQGIPDEYMQLLWRAHYSIPAPGQLYDMLHRLRPGTVDASVETTQDTIRAALQQQDISPKWVDRLMAISYRPLTRIDAARAYKIGALNYDDLVSAYRDLGYGADNAERLANFQSRSADLSFQRHWTVKSYAKGEITAEEMRTALETDGATEQGVTYAFNRASVALRAGNRAACAKSYRQRYLTGDLDLSDVTQSLIGQGLAPDQVDAITAGWQCEKSARGKAIPAGEICGLYEMGAITIVDVVTRLQRVGYTYDDAVLLARKCAQKVQDKITKQEQQALKQQQAADQRQAKALARSAAQEARAIKQGQALAQKAAATKVAREKRLIEAGEKFSKHFSGSLPDSILAVKAMFNQFTTGTLWTQDEVINALLVVTQSPEVFDLPTLSTALQAALAV